MKIPNVSKIVIHRGDIWDCLAKTSHYIAIPTNMTLNKQKHNVMGRGMAAQAAKMYSSLPKLYGKRIRNKQTIDGFTYFKKYRLIMLPVKQHYSKSASLSMIEEGLKLLSQLLDVEPSIKRVCVPMLGCGFGGLLYEQVLPIILKYYHKRMIVVIPPDELYANETHRESFLPGAAGRKDRRVSLSGMFSDVEI